MKYCKKCETTYEGRCQTCRDEYDRKYYEKNKVRIKSRNKAFYDNNRDRLLEKGQYYRDSHPNVLLVKEYKSKGCEHCPEMDIIVMDCHHIDPDKKLFGLTYAHIQSRTEDEVRIELEKCSVLCRNCHAREHHRIGLSGDNK